MCVRDISSAESNFNLIRGKIKYKINEFRKVSKISFYIFLHTNYKKYINKEDIFF